MTNGAENLISVVFVLLGVSIVTFTPLSERTIIIHLAMMNALFVFPENTSPAYSKNSCSHTRHAVRDHWLGYRYCCYKELSYVAESIP